MWRISCSILVGLLIGAGLGSALAVIIYPPAPEDDGWVSYPTLANPRMDPQGLWFSQHVIRAALPEYRYWLFHGLLYGGGFGAVTGAIAAVASALAQARKQEQASPTVKG